MEQVSPGKNNGLALPAWFLYVDGTVPLRCGVVLYSVICTLFPSDFFKLSIVPG